VGFFLSAKRIKPNSRSPFTRQEKLAKNHSVEQQLRED
jgi:hypothetical protein